MSVVLLVISLWGVPQLTFPIDPDTKCEDVARHPAVVEDYRAIFGTETLFYCVE